MADNNRPPSRSLLSHSSDEDNSSDHSPGSFATLSCGGSGSIIGSGLRGYSSLSNHKPPPTSAAAAGYCILPRQPMNDQTPTPKRPRGRPPGSKNKPKPPIVIKQDSEEALKPVLIEITAGNDVVEAVIAFARRRRVGISVLSGSGSVSDVTLRHPVSRAPVFPIHGPFHLLSLTGTYISGRYPSLLSSNPAVLSPCSSFGICLAGSQGQVFGGVVGGKVIAASLVAVLATVFKKPEFHRVPFMNGNNNAVGEQGDHEEDDADDNKNNAYAAIMNNADRSSGVVVSNGIGTINNNNNNNNGIAMIPNMTTAFGVANSTQLSDMHNVMQWNHPAHLP